MQLNDPVTLVKRYPQWDRLPSIFVGSGKFRQMLVNFDFFIKLAAARDNS